MPSIGEPPRPSGHPGLFHLFEGRRGVVLAVSGGTDSSALLLLASRWRDEGGSVPLSVATVDHGLRPESVEECARVATLAARHGLRCRILRWEGSKPNSRLQERARQARLVLLAKAAEEAGADAVALAHTRDDQAETVLMRLAHGSGPDGLAGMRPETLHHRMMFLRPLLRTARSDLAALLRAAQLAPIEDPSNADPRYERVRARRLLAAIAPLGLTAERLARLAERQARASDALEAVAAARFATLSSEREAGLAFAAAAYAAEPEEIRLRILAKGLVALGGPSAPPLRLERLEALAREIGGAVASARPLRRTLAGATVAAGPAQIDLRPERPRRRGRRSTYASS
jgi:tRNA(Ile)-lysidine synthase